MAGMPTAPQEIVVAAHQRCFVWSTLSVGRAYHRTAAFILRRGNASDSRQWYVWQTTDRPLSATSWWEEAHESCARKAPRLSRAPFGGGHKHALTRGSRRHAKPSLRPLQQKQKKSTFLPCDTPYRIIPVLECAPRGCRA